jgi:hypothetical protein
MNISLESLIILLIVAGLVGAIGQRLAGSSRGGLSTSIKADGMRLSYSMAHKRRRKVC